MLSVQASRVIDAGKDAVWSALNDPDVLKATIPGCERFERVGDDRFETEIVLHVGPLKPRFRGTITLHDVLAPDACTIAAEGAGGLAGHARGTARLTLTEFGARQTRIDYDVGVEINGAAARLGRKLVGASGLGLADRFFDRFERAMAGTGRA